MSVRALVFLHSHCLCLQLAVTRPTPLPRVGSPLITFKWPSGPHARRRAILHGDSLLPYKRHFVNFAWAASKFRGPAHVSTWWKRRSFPSFYSHFWKLHAAKVVSGRQISIPSCILCTHSRVMQRERGVGEGAVLGCGFILQIGPNSGRQHVFVRNLISAPLPKRLTIKRKKISKMWISLVQSHATYVAKPFSPVNQ